MGLRDKFPAEMGGKKKSFLESLKSETNAEFKKRKREGRQELKRSITSTAVRAGGRAGRAIGNPVQAARSAGKSIATNSQRAGKSISSNVKRTSKQIKKQNRQLGKRRKKRAKNLSKIFDFQPEF